jgi:Cd2+/Zn2+-exporting ATPase/Cu+-exporting ATPase
MSTQPDQAPDLAEQTLKRTTAPATSGQEMKRPAHDHEAEVEHEDGEHEHALEWPEMLRIGLVAVAAAAVWWRLWEPLSVISVIGVGGLLIGGWPIF